MAAPEPAHRDGQTPTGVVEADPTPGSLEHQGAVMSSTSMLTPTTLTMSSRAWLRVTAGLFVAIAFLAIAFAVGRSTASAHRVTTVIARPSISVPAAGTVADGCRTGRPPC